MTRMLIVFLSLFSGMISAFIVVIGHQYMYGKTYGVIRLDEIIAENISKAVTLDLDEKGMMEQSEVFSVALEESLSALDDRGVVLFMDAAVVGSVPDYTDLVKSDIQKRIDSNDGKNSE